MPHSRKVALHNGVNVTQLALGTAPLGGLFNSVSEFDGQAALNAAFASGINFVDTAPHYGKGVAETRVGEYLRNFPRSSYVISSKVGRVLVPSSGATDPDFADANLGLERVFDYSAAGIERSLKDSLERLGLDFLDIAFIHDPDDYADVAISQAYPALEKLRDQGLIKLIGVGMNQSAIPTRFVNETGIDLVLIAGRYTLLNQSAAEDLLPAALARGVDIIIGGVFNSGVLANPVPTSYYDYAPVSDEVLVRALKLESILEEFGITLAEAAIQFPLQHPAVKSVLVGCRSAAEVKQNIEAFDTPIPQSAWAAVGKFIESTKAGKNG